METAVSPLEVPIFGIDLQEDFKRAKPDRFAMDIVCPNDDVVAYFKTRKEVDETGRMVLKMSPMDFAE